VTRIVGIDPGVQCALALLNGAVVEFNDNTMVKVKRGASQKKEPEARFIANALRRWAPDLVIIEKVHGFPGESIAAVNQFMRARGICEGVAAGLGVPYELVEPARWYKDLKLRRGDDASRLRCLELWPALAGELEAKNTHNKADALLLALWGQQFVIPGHPLFG